MRRGIVRSVFASIAFRGIFCFKSELSLNLSASVVVLTKRAVFVRSSMMLSTRKSWIAAIVSHFILIQIGLKYITLIGLKRNQSECGQRED